MWEVRGTTRFLWLNPFGRGGCASLSSPGSAGGVQILHAFRRPLPWLRSTNVTPCRSRRPRTGARVETASRRYTGLARARVWLSTPVTLGHAGDRHRPCAGARDSWRLVAFRGAGGPGTALAHHQLEVRLCPVPCPLPTENRTHRPKIGRLAPGAAHPCASTWATATGSRGADRRAAGGGASMTSSARGRCRRS